MKLKLSVALILIFLAVVFIVQNTEVVSVNLYFWTLMMSRIILIAGMFTIGCIVGYLLGKSQKI